MPPWNPIGAPTLSALTKIWGLQFIIQPPDPRGQQHDHTCLKRKARCCSLGYRGARHRAVRRIRRERVHLIEGAPGSGKTTLGLQFLMDGVARGERGLYITLSE